MNNAPDYRLGHILHKGDQICADGAVYTITGDPLGFGGTSVLYPAISNDSKLEIAIKEAFPGGAAWYHRSGGVVRPVDPKDVGALGQLEQYRKQIKKEMELGQTIRNSSVRAIGLWKNLVPSSITVDGKNYTEVSDGIYSILERMDRKGKTFNQLLQYISDPPSEDAPLKTGYLPKIHTTALMMEQVLLALQRVHTAGENGFLFGDIQDGNVFFSDCRLEQGDIGIGNLLDFGCARPLVDGYQTEEITDRQIFSTMGFIPPEILDPEKNNGTLRLTRAADIYSVGCLMLRCLLSPASIKLLGASPVVDAEAIDEEAASRLSCPESIRNLLNLILQKALQTEPEDRYLDTDAMLADIRKLKQDTAPPTYLLPKAPGSSASFVEGSRDEEIRRIMQALKVNTPAFLWGCGGIGKSEIAIKVAQEFEKISPKGAYFVHYTIPTDEKAEAMEETVLRMPFEGYKYEPEEQDMGPEEQRKADYRKRIGILKKEYAGALLIIDNFDWSGKTWADLTAERSYQEIVSLGLNLVFTTRNEVPGTKEVKELSREDLLKLMRRWCTDPKITNKQLLALIDAVDGHTMIVDIMAKTLEESWGDVTPKMMLDAIKSCKLAQADYPEVPHQTLAKGQDPKIVRHRDQKTANIYEHLKALFRVKNLDEDAKRVLSYTSLFPDGGMLTSFLLHLLSPAEKKQIKLLVKQGWIFSFDRDMTWTDELLKAFDILPDTRMLYVHPLIREVICNEVSEYTCYSIDFLEKMKAYYYSVREEEYRWASYFNDDHKVNNPNYPYIADCYIYASKLIPEYESILLHDAGKIYQDLADQRALGCFQKAVALEEKKITNTKSLIKCYSSLGDAYADYRQSSNKSMALKYAKKAIELMETEEYDTSELAKAYHKLAYRYHFTSDQESFVYWMEKCVSASLQCWGPQHPRVTSGYECLVEAYRYLISDYETKCCRKRFYEDCRVNNPRLFARRKLVYQSMLPEDEYLDRIASYQEKVVCILKKILPQGHSEIADSYYKTGHAYTNIRKFETAFKWYVKAARAGNTSAMNSLANCYFDGKGCSSSSQEAFQWWDKAYRCGHVISTNNLGWAYLHGHGCTKNISQAIYLFKKAATHPTEPSKASNRHLGKLYLGVHPAAPNFDGIDPVKAQHYLTRAKELGAEDVDDLLETARKMIDET